MPGALPVQCIAMVKELDHGRVELGHVDLRERVVWRKDVDRLWHRGGKGEKSRGGAALGVHHALCLAVRAPLWCV